MLWGRTPSTMTNAFMQELERKRQLQQAEIERQRQAQSIQAMFQSLGIETPNAGAMSPPDARTVAGGILDQRQSAAARTNKIADANENRTYQQQVKQQDREYQEKRETAKQEANAAASKDKTADERQYRADVRDESRAYNEGQKDENKLVGTDYDVNAIEGELNDIYSSLAGYPEERLKDLEAWIDSPDVQAKLRAIANYDKNKSEQIRQMYSNALQFTRSEIRKRKVSEITNGAK